MKQLSTLILALIMVLALAACVEHSGSYVTGENTYPTANTAEKTDGTVCTTENTAIGDSTVEASFPDATPNTTAPTTNPVTNTTSATRPSHTHSYAATVIAPSCADEGYTTHKCSCGNSYISNKTSPTGHSFGQWETTKAATETATGTAQRICDKCNTTETKTLGKLSVNHSHDYTQTITQAATCAQEGIKTYICSCGDSFTDRIPKESHNYKTTAIREPDCLNAGYSTYTCITCGYSFNTVGRPADPTAHIYSETEKSASCTEYGYKITTCSECGETYYSGTISPLEHDYGTIVCETEHTCSRCGEKEYIGHLFGLYCNYCGIPMCDFYGHSYEGDIQCQKWWCRAYDPEAIAVVERFLSENITSDMTEYEKVRAIYEYIAQNVCYDMENYRNDTVPPESYTPRGALLCGTAVCNGYAETFDLLCLFAGIESKYVIGKGMGALHAWNQVKIDGNWYNIDLTWDDTDDERILEYKYFLLSDDLFYRSHKATSEKYDCKTSYKGTHPSNYLY